MKSTSAKTLVEIDIGKLETYLVSIKEQLTRHEEELHSPVWWAAFKAEVDQVAVLGKKIEHQQLDINILKDLLVSNPVDKNQQKVSGTGSTAGRSTYQSYSSPSHGTNDNVKELDKRQQLLAADLESTKILIRRMESQRAQEHLVFSQIRELQRGMRNVSQLLEERAPADALRTLMELVLSFQQIKPLFDNRLTEHEKTLKKGKYYVSHTMSVILKPTTAPITEERLIFLIIPAFFLFIIILQKYTPMLTKYLKKLVKLFTLRIDLKKKNVWLYHPTMHKLSKLTNQSIVL